MKLGSPGGGEERSWKGHRPGRTEFNVVKLRLGPATGQDSGTGKDGSE